MPATAKQTRVATSARAMAAAPRRGPPGRAWPWAGARGGGSATSESACVAAPGTGGPLASGRVRVLCSESEATRPRPRWRGIAMDGPAGLVSSGQFCFKFSSCAGAGGTALGDWIRMLIAAAHYSVEIGHGRAAPRRAASRHG